MTLRTSLMLPMVVLAIVTSAGCGGVLLPTEKKWTESPWNDFVAAKEAFDQVTPQKTTAEELKDLGFDPYENHNVAFLNYMDVFIKFVPNASITLADQDPAIQRCFQVRNRCNGLKVVARRLRDKEHGNVLLSMLTFRRQNTVSEWKFTGWLVLIDNQVVYKLWEGDPALRNDRDKIRPLGFLQTPLDFLKGF